MELFKLPIFDDAHRELAQNVGQLCGQRLRPLSGMELEDTESATVEYVALLGQEGLFDPAVGPALEGDAPRPDLRSLCLIRRALGQTSGLADAAYGAQIQGMFPIALAGNEDQRAIFLPSLASGQNIVSLALLDGEQPTTVEVRGTDYVLSGQKAMVPLSPVANQIVVLARHHDATAPKYSLFVVDARQTEVVAQDFVSPMPVGAVRFNEVVLDEEARLGGEGQGLVIAQATLDILRLPTASACAGIGREAVHKGTETLLRRGVGGRPLKESQGSQWELAELWCQLEAAELMVMQAAWRRDVENGREVLATTVARHLAQEAAERACSTLADLNGVRGLQAGEMWTRSLNEVRALRLESEFLEHPKTVVAQSLMARASSSS